MYYYIGVEEAKRHRVLLLRKSESRIPNIDSVFGKGVAVEYVGDSLPISVVYDGGNRSVRAESTQERKTRNQKRLYTGVSILGKVWTDKDFNLETFIKKAGDNVNGTLNFTSGTPIKIPHGSGISAFTSSGGVVKIGRTSGSEVVLSEGASNTIIGGSCRVNGSLNSGAISSSGTITASGDIVAYSDRRIKSDFKKIDNPVEAVRNLTGYKYRLKTDNTKHIGLIAQEVEEVIPEAVSIVDAEKGYKGVAYGNLVGLLVEAIKELDTRIKHLEELNKL